ncbi:putative enzyme [Klebsiella pneumoniae]|uniref:Putative enzyme n=1 Tax=Klebsiella pneumoniae TaxID=573 RepID=A0A377TY95_KLEPN|nr:putative enzyme [Klebsiella pneumoniae]
MSRFRHVELQYASRLLNHGPTILITSYDAPSDRRNVMAAAWSMPVEFAPPRVAIVVDKAPGRGRSSSAMAPSALWFRRRSRQLDLRRRQRQRPR